MSFRIFLIVVIFSLGSCTHDSIIPQKVPVVANVSVTSPCASCPTDPICPVVDDIVINSSTVYSVCAPTPAGQGNFTLDANHCLIWTSASDATEIVNTCIVACSGNVCDTTSLTIFPPVPGDTIPTGNPCVPGIIYFEKDVLPILTANCAYSGCHNAASRKEGVILDNYSNVIKTGGIRASNPGNSELYSVIISNNSKKVMPPPPATKLTTEQKNIIFNWIAQGAKDEKCDENPGGCDTVNVSFSKYVKPTLASCTTCHKTGNEGGGINLDSYSGFRNAALSGRLYGSIAWVSGYQTMPQGGSKLPACTIDKIKSWIDNGAANN